MPIVDTIEANGVMLRRLTADKIETVRRWRNNPSISQYMHYREHINPEQQQAWFERIDNDRNHYYIVECNGKDVGLVNIKDVDYDNGTGESGIFMWDNTIPGITIRAIVGLTDFAFDVLKLRTIESHILKSNNRAIRLTKSIGNELAGEDGELSLYTLTAENYHRIRPRLTKFL